MSLTREQIEQWRTDLSKQIWGEQSRAEFNALCDLALTALAAQPAQEADSCPHGVLHRWSCEQCAQEGEKNAAPIAYMRLIPWGGSAESQFCAPAELQDTTGWTPLYAAPQGNGGGDGRTTPSSEGPAHERWPAVAAPSDAGQEAWRVDGELWSALRSVLAQGSAIQQDYVAGRYGNYEEYSSRLDSAARELVSQFRRILSATPSSGGGQP